jgi:hypothetical protein
MAKLERVKYILANNIRHAEVRQQLALTDCPRGPWNKERALRIGEEIQEYKEALKILDPDYDYRQERFALDFMYELYCEDYPTDGEKLWQSLK